MHNLSRAIILVMGSLALPMAWAQLPDYYPAAFDLGGTVERIDSAPPAILVNDQHLRLEPNVRVHTLSSRNLGIDALHPGQSVGVQFSATRGSTPLVRDIWVLPEDQQMIPPPPGNH